jgi:thiamine biosynthesis lipoprotein
MIKVFRLILICFLALVLATCNRGSLFKEERLAMDTFSSIMVVASSPIEATQAIDWGFKEIERIGKLVDYYSEASEISAVNRASGVQPVKVSQETLLLVQAALSVSQLTGGAYDPTIGPVVRLWDFQQSVKPDQTELNAKLGLVDYKKVVIDKTHSTIFLQDKGMALDLGGIAKGFGADRAIEALQSKGISAALVAIGGDIRGLGLKPDNRPWRIGIQHPRTDSNQSEEQRIFASLPLNNQAISTSGDYQRYFIKDRIRYHHLLNPITGLPAKGLISVTIIANEGVQADALATGVFVMGLDSGLKLLRSLGVDGVLVDEHQKIHITHGLDKIWSAPLQL